MTARRRRPVERAIERLLDLTVFGPLGFALEARQLMPELAARGRRHVEAQLQAVRSVGDLAAQLGHRERPPHPTPERTRPDPTQPVRTQPDGTGEIEVRIIDESGDVEQRDEADSAAGMSLPIAGYDALAASQVVARLAGLTPDERAQVRTYEAAHRGRRTILHRAGQLLDHAPGSR
jgi:hypothetical protein